MVVVAKWKKKEKAVEQATEIKAEIAAHPHPLAYLPAVLQESQAFVEFRDDLRRRVREQCGNDSAHISWVTGQLAGLLVS